MIYRFKIWGALALLLLGTDLRASCPLKTRQEWQAFLELHSQHPGWVQTCEDGECDEAYFEFVLEKVLSVFEECGNEILKDKKITACTDHYVRFVPAWLRQHDSENYGFDVPNDLYLRNQESDARPKGMMRVPDVIVAALPDRKKVEEAARRHGYKYLTQASAIDGTRTFILNPDPNGRYDQWLLLNLKEHSTQTSTKMPVSVLSVEKKDAKGNAYPRVRLHFRDYDVLKNKDHVELVLKEQGNGKCYACHASGVRQLIARRTPELEGKPILGEIGYRETGADAPKDFGFRRLMEFNRRLRSYGQPDWTGFIDPKDHGPVIGKKQSCTDCHDGKSRGVLNISTSTDQLTKKIFAELSMPYDTHLPELVERSQMHNPDLSAQESRRLKRAFGKHKLLLKEYLDSRLPELSKWLLEVPCT